jgi:hypothetical protein
VIRQPLQLQRDAPQRLRPGRFLGTGQSLDDLAIRGGVSDRRVSGQRFGVMDGARVRPADHPLLHASVLISEGNFQMEHLFAVALKPKMARLDDAGVDRSHGHLMHLLAFDTIEIGDADPRRIVVCPAPRIVPRTIRAMIPHRLEPGMPLGSKSELLSNLALE